VRSQYGLLRLESRARILNVLITLAGYDLWSFCHPYSARAVGHVTGTTCTGFASAQDAGPETCPGEQAVAGWGKRQHPSDALHSDRGRDRQVEA
jgi:hypothetical protein